ncbi:PepSY domain-containing protein [Streptomyces kronopolitis]|uniref:PepSY domain-containing protein n=1 Tax=Streptomyces kronopolitis TaxID=1612435 RepID=UPI0020BFD18F|nr:PepSY domain-containing protein [Streptomyces kronopolitis]MCL6299099.1 PepSY domain-containing protein [Streptomyces kronopolitis]
METKRSDVVTRRAPLAVPRAIGLVCAAAAAGALVSGCGNSPEKDTGSPRRPVPASAPASPSSSLSAAQAQRKALVPSATVDYAQAMKAAVAAVPASEPIAAELKGTATNPYWNTSVATSDGTVSDVRVDARTGKAGQPQTESDDSGDKQQLAARLSKATVTAQQAAQTATEKSKGTVTSVELGDSDHGSSDTPAWAVGVVSTSDWNETSYEIDATNRKVLWMHAEQS